MFIPTSPRPPYSTAAEAPAAPSRLWVGVAWGIAFETLVLGAIALAWFARG